MTFRLFRLLKDLSWNFHSTTSKPLMFGQTNISVLNYFLNVNTIKGAVYMLNVHTCSSVSIVRYNIIGILKILYIDYMQSSYYKILRW